MIVSKTGYNPYIYTNTKAAPLAFKGADEPDSGDKFVTSNETAVKPSAKRNLNIPPGFPDYLKKLKTEDPEKYKKLNQVAGFLDKSGAMNQTIENFFQLCLKNPDNSNFEYLAQLTRSRVSKLRMEPQTAGLLDEVKTSKPQKYELLLQILKNTEVRTKTIQGVTPKMQVDFVEELIAMDEKLLQNIVDNNVSIKLYDDAFMYPGVSPASYGVDFKGNKALQFNERYGGKPIMVNGVQVEPVKSLAHELGHAYDYNNTISSLGLTPADDGVTPNAEKTFYDGKQLKPERDGVYNVHLDNASFSLEFKEAIERDYANMSAIDAAKGLKEGTTLDNLIKDPKTGYYFGGQYNKQGELTAVHQDIAKFELFAQAVSKITTGTVTTPEFDSVMEDYLPNILEFTRSLLER